VLKDGRLMQVGTPGELYHKPNSSFVADFIGQTNLISGKVIARDNGRVRISTAVGEVTAIADGATNEQVMLSIRPEQMRIARNAPGQGFNRMTGRVLETTFLGEASEHLLLANNQRLKVISAPPMFDVPAELSVEFDAEDVVVLPE
jgi:ABC-type Fe3+/spermidine/putrescine transport system ATPase subunit